MFFVRQEGTLSTLCTKDSTIKLLPFSKLVSGAHQYIPIMYHHFYASNYNVHAVFSYHKFSCCYVTHEYILQ
jgi:hypothetical protein